MAVALLPFAFEAWRKAMLLLALAAVPLLLAGSLVADPPRRIDLPDAAEDASPSGFLALRWRSLGLFAGVAGSLLIAVQALNPLIALALQRRFATPLDTIGHTLGIVTLVTSIGCLPVAGLLDRWVRRCGGLTARPIIMGACALAAIPPAVLLPVMVDADHALLMVALFLFLTCIANALVPTMLQDLTPASLRACSFTLWSFVVSIFCAAGPLIAGNLSDVLVNGQLLTAIAITSSPALLLSAACAVRLTRSIDCEISMSYAANNCAGARSPGTRPRR